MERPSLCDYNNQQMFNFYASINFETQLYQFDYNDCNFSNLQLKIGTIVEHIHTLHGVHSLGADDVNSSHK